MTEKDFLRAVRDADRSYYARAAAHAAEAEQKKQKGSDFMKRAVRYLLAGSTVLAAAAGVCILTGVFAKPHMDRDYAGVSEIYTEREIMLRAEYENLKMPEQISLKEYTQLYAYTTPEETEKVRKTIIVDGALNSAIVGQKATKIAEMADVYVIILTEK